MRSLLRQGGRIDVAPKVTELRLEPLKVENLKAQIDVLGPQKTTSCPVHWKYKGHLMTSEGGKLLLPGWGLPVASSTAKPDDASALVIFRSAR